MKKNVLGIDTSHPITVISINGKAKAWESKKNQSKELLPEIDKLLKKTKVKKELVKGVVVNIGPGSFTGLRVGVTVANGFGYALKVPVRGMSEFDIIQNVYKSLDFIVLDAKRNEIFVQKGKSKPTLMTIDNFGRTIRRGDRVYLDDAGLALKMFEALKKAGTIFIPNFSREEKMSMMLEYANMPKTFKQVMPLYLRGANITKRKKK